MEWWNTIVCTNQEFRMCTDEVNFGGNNFWNVKNMNSRWMDFDVRVQWMTLVDTIF